MAEQPEAIAEAFGQGGQGQRAETSGGELDGQRQVVQPPTDVLDDVAGRAVVREEARPNGAGAIDEQLNGGQRRQAADRHQDFPGDAERLATGSD